HADAVGQGSVALARTREAAGGDGAYDLVLLDFQMPGLDGLEVARTMAADLSLGGVRVILLTSAGDERHAAREAGVALTLTKPVRAWRLRALVRFARGRSEWGAMTRSGFAAQD